jgi:hypothetical protein
VWAGTRSPEKEKKRGMEIALEYVGLLNRPAEAVLFTQQLEEPLSFTAHFHPWVPFTAVTAALPKGSFLLPSSSSPTASHASQVLQKYEKKYSYDFLKQKGTPPEVRDEREGGEGEGYLPHPQQPTAFHASQV